MNSLLRLAAYQIYLFQGQKDRSNAKPLYSFQLFHILYLLRTNVNNNRISAVFNLLECGDKRINVVSVFYEHIVKSH